MAVNAVAGLDGEAEFGAATIGGNLAGDASDQYRWETVVGKMDAPRERAFVQLMPGQTGTIWVRFNATTITKTASGWDVCLSAGDMAVAPPGMKVRRVMVLTDTNARTYGTDFVVKGLPGLKGHI